MIVLSRSQLNSLIKGKLPTIALMVLVVLMQFAVSLVLVTSLSGIHYNQIELKKQESDLDKWKEEKDYYTFPYASINLQVSNQEAKAWWNFYNMEVRKMMRYSLDMIYLLDQKKVAKTNFSLHQVI